MLNEYTTQKISKLIKKGINNVISLSINELEDLSSGNVRFLYSYKNEFIYINIENVKYNCMINKLFIPSIFYERFFY